MILLVKEQGYKAREMTQLTLLERIRWRAIEEDIQYQLLPSTCKHIHMYVYNFAHVNTNMNTYTLHTHKPSNSVK